MVLNIYEQLKYILEGQENTTFFTSEIKEKLVSTFGTNPSSIIVSDYCYNRYNKGINFDKHLFIYLNRSLYKYVGENFSYTGFIYHRSKKENYDSLVGEWQNGKYHFYPNEQLNEISTGQIKKLYEEYLMLLHFEIHVLGCKPTELRHLIGRLGEFYCAIHTNGTLAKETNQQGYDVVTNGRRISVKTTAQDSGFVSINKNTFEKFDDLFVAQYVNDELDVLFFEPKEKIPASRQYGNRYEIDLSAFRNKL